MRVIEKNNNDLYFKIDLPQFLKEIADCGLDRKMGTLKIPLNIARQYLCMIAERAAEINDPQLNLLMIETRLYETPAPNTKEYRELHKKIKESIVKK